MFNRRQFLKMVAAIFAASGFALISGGTRVQARHVICIVGGRGWLRVAAERVAEFGRGFTLSLEYSQDMTDDRMGTAFEAAFDRIAPTYTAEDRAAVQGHQSVAYVLSPHLTQDTSIDTSTHALELTGLLLESGGLAAKSESAGVAHGRHAWLSMAHKVIGATPPLRNELLYRAWVRRPLTDEDIFYSCGMHLLGHPDIECSGQITDLAAASLIDDAARHLLNGEGPTLRPSINNRYPSDDYFFNPFGYVRIDRSDA